MPDFSRGPFYEIFKIPNFRLPPWPALPACLPASGHGPIVKSLLPTFFYLLLPFPKRCDMTPLPQNLGRRWFGRKVHFLGLGGVQTICPKITCNESGWPWKFDHYLTMKSKIISHCSGDRRTHILNPPKWKFFVKLFYAWGMENFKACKFSTILLREEWILYSN